MSAWGHVLTARECAHGQQARCPTGKASMMQLFMHDDMMTMNLSKAADALLIAFYVNGWACNCMRHLLTLNPKP
eukprot:361414-Chlamydomonas_euryale.AAC.1